MQKKNEMEGNQLDEEIEFLNELESKIRGLPNWAEIAASSELRALQDVTQQELTLLNRIKENDSEVLLSATKHKNHIIVNFLISCGVNVNSKNGKLAVEYAWSKKSYKILLSLLKAGSFYPDGFSYDELGEDDNDAKEIKKLVDSRTHLHELIKNGDVKDVKNFKFNETAKSYLSTKNESAAYAALRHKNFSTYAYLKSIGAEFGKNNEKLAIEKFELSEKIALQEAMVQYFPSVPDAHIYYLISKSRSQKPVMHLTQKLIDYYKKLDNIPEISLILKVIQYADYLDIIFDFDEEEISKVNPVASKSTRGEARYLESRIYIAANPEKRPEREILGTIAHELTHMAMQILYENDCNPYGKFDDEKIILFQILKRRIRRLSGDQSKILLDVMEKYDQSDHDSELIVRVPQILIQFEDGKEWISENYPQLLGYFKQTIEPKCQEFLSESGNLKPKSMIKSKNESIGEILKLKKCNVFFKKVENVFDNKDSKIFVYKVESILLGTLKALQRLYGKNYENFHSNFLILKLKKFISRLKEISLAFFMEGCKWLIIEISHDSLEEESDEVFESISELLETKPNKRILFVTHQSVIKLLRKKLKSYSLLSVSHEVPDDELSFDHLDGYSQEQILGKMVTFQGKPTLLHELIPVPELYKLISLGVIEALLKEGKVNIGSEILGLSSLEGPYTDIIQDMDFESFVRRVGNSNDIFIVRSKQNEEVVTYFNKNFKGKWISTKFFKNIKYDIKEKVNKEKIFLVNDRFKTVDFKRFCKTNPDQKCYLIEFVDYNSDSFVLLEIYNPEFYIRRKVKKIMIMQDEMENLISKNKSETFLVQSENPANNIIKNYTNLQWVTEEKAKNEFKSLKGTVHWFRMEDEFLFTWKNSYGSVTNLRSFVHSKTSLEIKFNKNLELLEEENLVSEVADRRVVLIADHPGTGKSTTITKLYEAKSIEKAHWIIRINLKDHSKAIKECVNSEQLSAKNVIKFLQEIEPNLKDQFNEDLLHVVLTNENKFSKCLLLAFDGFDEILDEDDRYYIINLLKFLKNKTPCKIWITSRQQYRNDLERALETFAIEFHPLDKKLRRLFIKKYLKDRLSLIIKQELFSQVFSNDKNSKICLFAEHLLSNIKEIFKKDVKKFIGTPLELDLVMSGSVEYFKKWAGEEKQVELQYLGRDLLEVYENFIEKKYRIYFKKFEVIDQKHQKRDKKESEKYNQNLSESLVYNKKSMKPVDIDTETILVIGLIVSQYDENFEFIHFTFREFYFAKVFAEYALGEEIPAQFYEKMIFLFEEIFVKKEFQMIRNFLNLQLNKKIPDVKLELFRRFFLGNNHGIMKLYTTSDSALKVCAEEGHENILNFIYIIYCHITPPSSFKITNILNKAVFSASMLCEKYEVFEVFLKILKKNLSTIKRWEIFYYQFLIGEYIHYVATRGNWKLMKTALEGIGDIFSEKEIRSFLIATNNKYQIFLKIIQRSDSFELLDLYLRIVGDVFSKEESEEYVRNMLILFTVAPAKIDPKFIQLLFQKWEDMHSEDKRLLLMEKDFFGNTILHTAAQGGNLEICQLILNSIKIIFDEEMQSKYLLLKNRGGVTALGSAASINRIKIVKFLTEKAKKILKTNENILEFLEVDVKELHTSFYKKDFKSIKFLLEKKVEAMSADRLLSPMMIENFYVEIFRWACLRADSSFLNFILKKLKHFVKGKNLSRIMMERDKGNNTCLHDAAKNDRIEFSILFDEVDNRPDLCKLIMTKNDRAETLLHHAAHGNRNLINIFEKTEEVLDNESKQELFIMEDRSGKTFFHLVVQNYTMEEIAVIWKKCEKLITPEYFVQLTGMNILHGTVQNRDPEVAKFILEKMDNLDLKTQSGILMATDSNNNTCLHLAARMNRKEFTTLFFEKMEKTLAPEDLCKLFLAENRLTGNTVLHDAAIIYEQTIMEYLLEKMDKVLPNEKEPEFLMATNNSGKAVIFMRKWKLKIIKLILEKLDVLTDDQLCKFLLLTENHEVLNAFLGRQSNNDEYIQIYLGKIEKIFKTNTPLRLDFLNETFHQIVRDENFNILKLFLKYLSEKIPLEEQREIFMVENSDKQTFLHSILPKCDKESILAILKVIENVLPPEDQRRLFMLHDNINGRLLHSATLNQNLDIVKLIFDKGEKILKNDYAKIFAARNFYRGSFLHIAVLGKKMDVVKFILEEGKRILTSNTLEEFFMMTDKTNRTVLHLAEEFDAGCNVGSPELLNLFLKEAEMLLNIEKRYKFLVVENKDRRTALHLAAKYGDSEGTKLLLQWAENYFSKNDLRKFLLVKDFQDRTAVEIAAHFINETISTLITTFMEEEVNFNDLQPKYC